ncbi:hypothetical protein CBR_g41218 [Chara braunii]|uniref:DDE Tnp4 domain-containing protein n=1 Tax=Chara braunii TaxID=69332 RepID=A0A388K2Q8_CHABU|nr:hypothetical protein CBR_g41218 [Chara braunii]|eukprot:GBG64299.1 hypothetical protein CBR_g41218 [Chara braunii]
MTGGAGSSGVGGSGGAQFNPLSKKEMAKLRRGNIVWNFVTAGQYVRDQSKMHGDRKLRGNLCGHLFLWTAQRVQRWMADEGIRDTRAPAGGQRRRMDDAERDDIQDALDEEEGREGGAGGGGGADEADEGVGEPDLPGEEVVMTSRGVGRAGPAPRAPRPELDRVRREKRIVGEVGVEVRDTGREKRAQQTTIDEMYAKEKLAEFIDAWLQWVYVKGLPFNAFRGPEFQKVRQAAERVPRSIQFRFPSFRVRAGAGIHSPVATMVGEVRVAFRHSGATILSDGRKSRSGKPLVNFLAGGANGALLYATVACDGSVRDTTDIVYRRPTRRVGEHVARGCLGTHPVGAQACISGAVGAAADPDREFWRCVQYAILVMSPVHQLLRRMDRGGMMMSVIYEWSQHVLQLMRRVDVPENMIEPCVREVAIRNLHMLEPAHAAAHLLNPRRQSLTYYHSLETTAADRRVVEECDKFLLAQTGGDPVGRLYRTVRDQMRAGDSETERCASWWFEHGRAHPELRTIAIRVMHLWTSASPAERNWAQHKRINTARHCKLGFAKLAQLVEIATNLKLASCAWQGGGYVLTVLPWVMGTGRGGTATEDEDEDGDVEPEVWGARPAGSVPEVEIERQIVAFQHSRPSRAHSVRDVFGIRATELRPWPEGGDDVDAAAADDDDMLLSSDPTTEQVYFTYGGGRDGMDSFTSVITRGASSTAQASGSSRAGGGRGGLSHAEVGVDDWGEQQPRGGLRQTGRRWEVRSDSEAEDEEVPLRDRRFSPSHHPISAQLEALRHSERLASAAGRDRTYDGEDRGGRGLLPTPREMETGGRGGRDIDASGVPEEAVQGAFDDDGQDAAAGGESSGGRRGDAETAGDEGQDVVMGGGSPSGGRGDSETAGDEGQGAAVCGRGEGGPGGDGDTAGVGGDDGPDGDDDKDHGPEDNAYRLALVLRDPTVPPLRPDDLAQTFFDVHALAQALTDDRFAHTGCRSGQRQAPGGEYSPPPFVLQSPRWLGSSLSGGRGRESRASEVGSGRCSDDGIDIAGSMPPPPARTPEARVDAVDQTAAPGVAHNGGSPPAVRGGVGGGWSSVCQVGDRLRADYDVGRGVFTGRTPVETQAVEGGSGRPSLHMAGRMLGLSRAETRRSLVLEATGTSTDMLRGEQFTSGDEGLLMHPGMRRQHGLSEVEARRAAGVVAGQAALDVIQREREMGIAARAAEDEDADIDVSFRLARSSSRTAAQPPSPPTCSWAVSIAGGVRSSVGRVHSARMTAMSEVVHVRGVGDRDDVGAELSAVERVAVTSAVAAVIMYCDMEVEDQRRWARLRARRRKLMPTATTETLDSAAICDAVLEVCCALGCGGLPRATPRWWVKRRTGGTWEDLRPADDATDDYFRDKLRMSPRVFREIVENLSPILQRRVTFYREPLQPDQIVAYALYRWTWGETYESSSCSFGIGRASGLVAIRNVTAALLSVYREKVAWPTGVGKAIVLRAFADKGFPNCHGCIDCTHIYGDKPTNAPAEDYYDRKRRFSVVAQVVVDLDLRILDVFVGYPGSCHDRDLARRRELRAVYDGGTFDGGGGRKQCAERRRAQYMCNVVQFSVSSEGRRAESDNHAS